MKGFYDPPHYNSIKKGRPHRNCGQPIAAGQVAAAHRAHRVKWQVLPQKPGLASAGGMDFCNVSAFNNFLELPRMFILLGNY